MSKRLYKPDTIDIDRAKARNNMFKVSGDGVFATLQGEGVTAGLPAVFLRLHYCNLACGKYKGWKCDTSYTWDVRRPEFWKEPEDWDFNRTTDIIKKAWVEKFGSQKEQRLVITGGEPLLQQKNIACLLKLLSNWNIEIETNGTITPIRELYLCQFNCSPKLKNSGNPYNLRYRPDVLQEMNLLNNVWFKFVVISFRDLTEVDRIVQACCLKRDRILIMPEGIQVEKMQKKADDLRSKVEERGWKLILRNQLIWFGSKRRT